MSAPKPTVLVIGGTGAQGVPVVKALAEDSKYEIKVLTRNASNVTAIELSHLPGVSIIAGEPYSEVTLHSALEGIDIVYANTNGFAIGEKAEVYWGIRIFEIARELGVKHFIWGSLESAYKTSGYQARFRTGHFDGKNKVADWIAAQPSEEAGMRWSVLTSCMYVEMLGEMLAPRKQVIDGEEVMVFQAPVGQGRPPFIYLEDLGRYARWLVENPEKSSGLHLKIATESLSWEEIAKTYTEVTGKKAISKHISLDEYFSSGVFPAPDAKVGHSVGHSDDTLQTYRQNFSGFWNTWKEGIVVRDYKILDEILPTRVKSVGEWMKLTGYTGERAHVLKDYRDAGY